ncbi:MAG: cysteine desulfurase NifS [Candidatus Thermoplasmatota archaeon]
MKKIYLDYAATTPCDPEVTKTMQPYFTKYFGNASSLHSFGSKASEALKKSRERVAEILNASPEEIVFTSGGTEADNLAIKGIAYQNKNKRRRQGPHIITSSIEHPAVLETCKHLEKQGFKIKYLKVDQHGLVDLEELEKSINENTFLITIMFANNEIGTIQPIKKIGEIAKENDVTFHTDAVQAIGKTSIDVEKMNIDMLSISSHKIYGPKGVGALYLKKGTKIAPLFHGGGHENGLRSSTENIPGIVGLGKACELAKKRIKKDSQHMKKLRDKLIEEISNIEESYLNGHPDKRLVNNIHFYFTAVEGESLILKLDDKNIAASTGSACSSKKLQASHVLLALGLKPEQAHGSLRLSLGRKNTMEEINYVLEILPDIVEQLREMSPLWKK